MSLYDYRCEADHVFEVRRSRGDKSPRRCPTCNAPAKRIFSGMPAIHFQWWNPLASSSVTTPAKNLGAVVNKKLVAGGA